MAFLRERIGLPPDSRLMAQLVQDLDSSAFDTRVKASAELEKMGSVTQPFLRKALDETNSAEVRRRIEELLERFKEGAVGEELRFVRIIDVCEHINSPTARELLQTIAGGSWGQPYGEAAKKALDRIGNKR